MKSEFNGIELTYMHELLVQSKAILDGVLLQVSNLALGRTDKADDAIVQEVNKNIATVKTWLFEIGACLKGGSISK